MTDRRWPLWGCVFWEIGSVLFLIAAINAGDVLATLGSILFFLGVAMFMVPMLRRE